MKNKDKKDEGENHRGSSMDLILFAIFMAGIMGYTFWSMNRKYSHDLRGTKLQRQRYVLPN